MQMVRQNSEVSTEQKDLVKRGHLIRVCSAILDLFGASHSAAGAGPTGGGLGQVAAGAVSDVQLSAGADVVAAILQLQQQGQQQQQQRGRGGGAGQTGVAAKFAGRPKVAGGGGVNAASHQSASGLGATVGSCGGGGVSSGGGNREDYSPFMARDRQAWADPTAVHIFGLLSDCIRDANVLGSAVPQEEVNAAIYSSLIPSRSGGGDAGVGVLGLANAALTGKAKASLLYTRGFRSVFFAELLYCLRLGFLVVCRKDISHLGGVGAVTGLLARILAAQGNQGQGEPVSAGPVAPHTGVPGRMLAWLPADHCACMAAQEAFNEWVSNYRGQLFSPGTDYVVPPSGASSKSKLPVCGVRDHFDPLLKIHGSAWQANAFNERSADACSAAIAQAMKHPSWTENDLSKEKYVAGVVRFDASLYRKIFAAAPSLQALLQPSEQPASQQAVESVLGGGFGGQASGSGGGARTADCVPGFMLPMGPPFTWGSVSRHSLSGAVCLVALPSALQPQSPSVRLRVWLGMLPTSTEPLCCLAPCHIAFTR